MATFTPQASSGEAGPHNHSRLFTIPLELQQEITSYLPPNDLESLRLSCRSLAQASRREVIQRLPKQQWCTFPSLPATTTTTTEEQGEAGAKQHNNSARDVRDLASLLPEGRRKLQGLHLRGSLCSEKRILADDRLAGLSFPNLRVLALKNFTTASAQPVIDLISAHAKTLRVLEISAWNVLTWPESEGGTHDFLDFLSDEMLALESLKLGRLYYRLGPSSPKSVPSMVLRTKKRKHQKRVTSSGQACYKLALHGVKAQGKEAVGDAAAEFLGQSQARLPSLSPEELLSIRGFRDMPMTRMLSE